MLATEFAGDGCVLEHLCGAWRLRQVRVSPHVHTIFPFSGSDPLFEIEPAG